MLRASSLGLSLPSPTIVAVQQWRRLYGARSRWDPLRGSLRSSSHSANQTSAHLFQPTPIHEQDAAEKSHTESPLQTLGRQDGMYSAYHASLELAEEKAIYTPAGNTTRPTTSSQHDQPRMLDSLQQNHHLGEVQPDRKEKRHNLNCSENATVHPRVPIATSQSSKSPVKPVYLPNSGQEALEILLKRVAHPTYHQFPQTANSDVYACEDIPDPAIELEIWTNLEVIGKTSSTDEAWDAYVYLVDAIDEDPIVQQHVLPHIPFSHLHRFCRLLAHNRPKTHRQFLRLLSVMTYIKHCGGELKQHEYNALIDHAGKGWRKTHTEDVAQSLRVFNDLMKGRMPGVSEHVPLEYQGLTGLGFKPDIYTVTSLIALTARSGDNVTLRGLSNLMTRLELAPNRITHLATLKYFVDKEDITGVRSTLQKMRQQGMEIGMDGLNACIMAYSRAARWDVSMMIYRLLRHNKDPETYEGEDDINDAIAQLGEEFIFVEADMIPNEVTYTSIIQVMAYHGHFRGTIEVFIDMLSSPNEENAPTASLDSDPPEPAPYEATLAVFRAIFLGFTKHGIPPSDVIHEEDFDWTLSNLRDIFKRFLTLPPDTCISHGNLHIILAAFAKTTDFDRREMRDAWIAIHDTFKTLPVKATSDSRLVKLSKRLFPEDASNSN